MQFFFKILRKFYGRKTGETLRSIKSRNFASCANFSRERERKEREKNREKGGEGLLFRFVSHPNERFDSIASRIRNTKRRENHWLEKTRGISNFIICFFFLSFSFFSFFLAAVHTSISGVRSTFLCIVYGKIVYICMSVFHVINF